MNIELLKRLGNMSQIAGIREVACTSGGAKGLGLYEVYNAAGLRFTVVPDRGLDIHDCSYKGTNLSFQSKNGLNTGRGAAEDDFFHQWAGGMLATCGLANVGDACQDQGSHPIHGRIGLTPARHVSASERWQGDDYILSVSGEVWETRLYGMQLSLVRTISTGLYDKAITITDTVTNHGASDEAFMLLYHFNFGFPLLDAGCLVVSSSAARQPRNDHSIDWTRTCAPDAEPQHQFFLHTLDSLERSPERGSERSAESGPVRSPERSPKSRARAAVINPALQLAGYLDFDTKNLPYMGEWKHMAAHDYVLALEPSNCLGLGRVNERSNGTLQSIPAYGSITHSLTLGVLDGETEIRAFTQSCGEQA